MTQPNARRIPVRFLVTASIAVFVWGIVTLGWLDGTVVPRLDQGLRDFYLSISVDSRPDDAPGLLHLTFDNEALASTGLPTRVPLSAIEDMLDAARNSMQTVILDVDLATRSDIEHVDTFVSYLDDWSRDKNAPLLVLAYPLYDVPYHDIAAFQRADSAVAGSPNIRWAGVGTFADDDGVVRNYEYWRCVERHGDGKQTALPSVALYAWARYELPSVADAVTAVESAMHAADAHCNETRNGARVAMLDEQLLQSGIIEFQTSLDALAGDGGGRFAPDGLPRLISVPYCNVSPAGCGSAAGSTNLDQVAAGRIILVSAANDFSRDEHATPVGYMSGSVILGNAARALINSGPPVSLPAFLQLVGVLAAVTVIHLTWSFVTWLRGRLRASAKYPVARKILHGIVNPAVVQWLAFAAADLMILFYYYHCFGSSEWNGLVGASFGATTVAAVIAFNDWWSTPWEKERAEE
jgi:hypothetical protein